MRTARQLAFGFRTWGGARKGAGRKPKGPRAGVSHSARPSVRSQHPVHVTLRVRSDVPSLRSERCIRWIRRAFAAQNARSGFHVVHYSIQSNHVHLVVEVSNRVGLARGAQGLSIRIARALNREIGRAGKVFADRYHARALRTPREVRNALRYVLLNRAHHAGAARRLDPCSSAWAFDGWTAQLPPRSATAKARDGAIARDVAPPRTWLLRRGWRRGGLLQASDVPV